MLNSETQPTDQFEHVERIIGEIASELSRLGYWSADPLPDEAYQFQQAFAMDTMTFSQWLQFILIPRVHEILEGNGDFPSRSMVGTQAIREFDGDESASRLVKLLNEFDSLFSAD
jgi:uncharacterized protein YqcC (DUF446 family)